MKNNKKAIAAIVIVCLVVLIAVAVVLVLGSAFKETGSIALKDSKGEEFATASWDGYDIIYTVDNEYEQAYAEYVTEEAKNILVEAKKTDADNENDYIFKNITSINTNYNPETQKLLKASYDKNKKLLAAECAMAVTDLNGKLIAVFSNGTEENLALRKTYAGSTIKPLSVYAPAIDSGKFNWSYAIEDSPVKQVQEQDGSLSDWPTNSDGRYTNKNMCLVDALAFSTNTVAVKLLQEYGVENSVKILDETYGMSVDFEKDKMNSVGEDEILGNIALGYLYEGVSVVDMAGYYQVFATGGKYTAPKAVDEIFDENGSVYKSEYTSVKAMKTETAQIMNKMLKKVVTVGTGVEANIDNVNVVGKTGTTSGNADNWFVGVTPEYSCAVWHSAIDDGNICPEVFAGIFESVEGTVEDFPGSGKIEAKLYCEKSGLLRGEKCIYCNKGYYLKTENLAQCEECK